MKIIDYATKTGSEMHCMSLFSASLSLSLFFVFSLLHWEFLDKLKKRYYSKLKILPAT